MQGSSSTMPVHATVSPRHGLLAAGVLAALAAGSALADEPAAASSHADAMARMGYVRHAGSWRTRQEMDLITRAERESAARREWKVRLGRLRQELDLPASSSAAAAAIRGIDDPAALSSLVTAVTAEPSARVRELYVEALTRIPSQDALAALVVLALDHPDDETRIAAVERLLALGPQLAMPPLIAALASADNAQVNRAAAALGRLGSEAAVPALVAALETEHMTMVGGGRSEGSMSVAFTPAGGGLTMGDGPKRTKVRLRNERVLEALVALTGENFQWNVAAWREWLTGRESAATTLDLRRGEEAVQNLQAVDRRPSRAAE
jgi:hypothetical protein